MLGESLGKIHKISTALNEHTNDSINISSICNCSSTLKNDIVCITSSHACWLEHAILKSEWQVHKIPSETAQIMHMDDLLTHCTKLPYDYDKHGISFQYQYYGLSPSAWNNTNHTVYIDDII